MVCDSKYLSEWKDFPKGLRVLVLDGNPDASSDMAPKLLSMHYIVTVFRDVNEALSAVSSSPENFHVAVVEMGSNNGDTVMKFLDIAHDLPTVMTSDVHCLSTTMKCIALGAVEFLKKPLSDEKLRNIWQHVVHKAFSSGGSEALKPVKDSVASMLKLAEVKDELADKFSAPSTPKLEQGKHLMEYTNCSSELEGESKSVESTKEKKVKPPRKKMKVDWTSELHKKFVQAVDHLGIDQAIPSRILEHMKVDGLTRHNVASHLQKYRVHRRSILPKAEGSRGPIMAYPTWNYPMWGPQQQAFWLPPWPGVHGNSWGRPVVPAPCEPPPFIHLAEKGDGYSEVIDEVVKEVMSKPWLPLPLGLKPPSTDSVLTELYSRREKA